MREACEHDRYEKHTIYTPKPGSRYAWTDGGPCPGGREVTINYEVVIYEWFDGQSLFADWSDPQVRGYAIALAQAIRDGFVAPPLGGSDGS
jgi:hypothetical protein